MAGAEVVETSEAAPGRWARARAFLRARYLGADLRTLGLFRIVIGTLLCLNLLRVWNDATLYYSNQGVFSNDWHLFRPSSEFNFSIFHAFSSPAEVHLAFALALACFFCFAIGYRTRLFNALSLLWITSLDNRLVMVENGGYVVVNLTVFWALFLPVGARFSVDALRRAFRESRTVTEMVARERPLGPHRSLASLFVLVNFGVVYIFNVVNKYGSTWREGGTVHYVLHLDRLGTPVAAWFRETLPFAATRVLSWSVLVVEGLIVVLIFWPHGRRYTRPLAQILIVGLHTTFGVMMQLGPFSWFMIGWSTILLCAVQWEALERVFRRLPGVEVSVDRRSGLGRWLGRLIALGDGPRHVRWTEHEGGEPLRVRRDGDAYWQVGRRAFWTAARATPGGRALSWLRLPSLGLVDLAISGALARPASVGRWLGLDQPRERPRPDGPPSRVRLRFERWGRGLREAIVILFALLFASQIINENKSIPPPFKHQLPKPLVALVVYPRLFQGWGMFAPNPVREDGVLAIEAVTVDGRRVDPLRGKEPDLNLSDDRGSRLNQIHQDYGNRIRQGRNRAHRQALDRFLQSYHRYRKNADDEIVAYAIWWLRDDCPDPGSTAPTNHEMICLGSWRKPGFRPPKGMVLPPRCKVASAGD
jgi:hypothetical protein